MNPDYYKTNHDKLYKHEMKRMDEMQDKQLYTRYDKMSKPDKIGAFYEALADKDRCPSLRKHIEKDGCVPKEKPMKFVKVTQNIDDSHRVLRQAIFENDGAFYLYSYSQIDVVDSDEPMIDETMTFRCDAVGTHTGSELFVGKGYIHSKDAMIATLANINTQGMVTE
jgi:hypothetical protein|tara:strand:- start:70 stop:570 length:501 start_codon:yes stop_codon:yes gene_type:complete